MKRNKLQLSKSNESLRTAVLTGVIVALLVSVFLAALMTNLVINDVLDEKSVNATVFFIRTISVLIGALVGGIILKHKYLLQVGFTTLGYILVLLTAAIVFYAGNFKDFLAGTISSLVGGGVALAVLQNRKSIRNRTIKISV